jgi:hypothetical protein
VRRLLVALVVVGAASSASANDRAKKLFEEGRALMKSNDYAAACAKFEESDRIEKALGTEANLADCYEKRAQTAKAYHLWRAIRHDADEQHDEARANIARDRSTALPRQLVKVVIHVPEPVPDDLAVTINGEATEPGAEIRDYADPGTIQIVITANGKVIRKQLRGEAGTEIPVDIKLSSGEEPPPPPPPEIGERNKGWVRTALVVGSVGVFALGVAAVLAIEAKGDNDDALQNHCDGDPNQCDSIGFQQLNHAGSLADAATIFSIGGAVVVAAGVTMYLVAPREAERVTIRPIASPHEIGVVVGGRF